MVTVIYSLALTVSRKCELDCHRFLFRWVWNERNQSAFPNTDTRTRTHIRLRSHTHTHTQGRKAHAPWMCHRFLSSLSRNGGTKVSVSIGARSTNFGARWLDPRGDGKGIDLLVFVSRIDKYYGNSCHISNYTRTTRCARSRKARPVPQTTTHYEHIMEKCRQYCHRTSTKTKNEIWVTWAPADGGESVLNDAKLYEINVLS